MIGVVHLTCNLSAKAEQKFFYLGGGGGSNLVERNLRAANVSNFKN